MKKQIFSILTLMLVCTAVMAQQRERKALFIGIDGVRSDALQQANTPNLDSLFATGISTYESWNLGVTSSGPAWTSMCTGVWEAKHRVFNNSYAGSDFNNYPFFPNYIKQINPDLKCVQIITWNPMDDADKGTGGNVYNAMWDLSIDAGNLGQGLVRDAAEIQLQDADLDVLFVHFDETDAAGHGSGFSPSVPNYMNAIIEADNQIGDVLAALRARPTYANEDWIIVGTTDHGGQGLGHGGNSDDERAIWWFSSGDGLPDTLLPSSDPGSYVMASNPVNPAILENVPVQTDIAVTIIDWMLPFVDPENVEGWFLDGKSWIPDSLSVLDTSQQIISATTTITFGIGDSVIDINNNVTVIDQNNTVTLNDGDSYQIIQNGQSYIVENNSGQDVTISLGEDLEFYTASGLIIVELTAIHSVKENHKISIFPNPATDLINISTNHRVDKSIIVISDLSGREVKRIEQSIEPSSMNSIDISSLTSGSYFFTINGVSESFQVSELLIKH